MQNRDKCARSILSTHARWVCGCDTSDMCHILGSESSNANQTQAKTAAQSSMAFMHTCSVMYKPLDRVAEQRYR